jgi:rubrerythrin
METIDMELPETKLVRCNECKNTFPADELVMSRANIGHSIADWSCPVCGGGDYDGVNSDGSVDSGFW